MTGLNLSIPTKRVSAWMAETDPKYARAWLASLPLADSAETAREIYQALYTLNRQELEVTRRFELMELYHTPVALVTTALETYFARSALPLTPKKRQLAEFIRQLHMEMAYGYKGCLQGLEKQRLRWGKKSLRSQTLFRAMHYLGEVLLHSYQVYMPYPPEVWREIHAIYRYAAEHDLTEELVDIPLAAIANTSISQEYIRILLLGLLNPYQLPQNECRQAQQFLYQWGAKAILKDKIEAPPSAGYFLIDPSADSSPVPFPRGLSFQPGQGLRVLDVVELLRTIQFFLGRLQKGDSARTLSLGIECLDSVCFEMLQRMLRSWGQLPRRQYSRIPRSGPAFACAGIAALHFFANGRKSFTPPVSAGRKESRDDLVVLPARIKEDIAHEVKKDEDFIALDLPVTAASRPTTEAREPVASSGEAFRVDRWQIKDSGPKGLQLTRFGGSHTYLRVGDIVGVQQMDEAGRWNAGVVRWMKSPQAGGLEMGVELLASGVKPVAVASMRGTEVDNYQPALLLPAMEALRRPAALLLPRGGFASGDNLLLADETIVRAVRLLQRLEHSHAFELLVFADVLA